MEQRTLDAPRSWCADDFLQRGADPLLCSDGTMADLNVLLIATTYLIVLRGRRQPNKPVQNVSDTCIAVVGFDTHMSPAW